MVSCDNRATMTTGVLFVLSSLSLVILGFKTCYDGNPVGYTELAFGFLLCFFGLDLVKNSRVQNKYNLRTIPKETTVELSSSIPKLIIPQRRSNEPNTVLNTHREEHSLNVMFICRQCKMKATAT